MVYNNKVKEKMSFGIEALELYAPKTFVDQSQFENYNGVAPGKYTKGLGQLQLSFATAAEDVNSIALTAVNNLMKNNNIHPSKVGRLEVGTQTLVDKSKSTKTVLMSLFQGYHDIQGATSINACYGGTNALLNSLNWMGSPSWDGRYAIVVAVDVAVYEDGPARPTGGAGAVAILLSPNPKIVIDPIRSSFVDNQWDFYKPVAGSQYPIVDGKYSMELYMKALSSCYQKLKDKSKTNNLIEENQFFCFHCPFAKMVQKAFESLLRIEYPGISSEEVMKRFQGQVDSSLFLSRRFGNIYNGSLYLCLLSFLFKNPEIKNKKGMLFSYGSGICSTLLSIEVKNNPIGEVQRDNIAKFIESRIKVCPKEYSKIMFQKEKNYGHFQGKIEINFDQLNDNCFYLSEIDNKWRRKYGFNSSKEISLEKTNINAIRRIPGIDARVDKLKVDTSKFYKMSVEGRRSSVEDLRGVDLNENLLNSGGISTQNANSMIENVIGKVSLPLAVVPSLKINEKEYTVPMCIEEPSVVAAVSSISKLLAPYGIKAQATDCQMIGQVHLPDIDPSQCIKIEKRSKEIVNLLNKECKSMVERGGGVKQISLRQLKANDKARGSYSLDIFVDVCDAMGANIINTLAEKAKQIISSMGIRTGISILSNYCVKRKAVSSFKMPIEALSWKGIQGEQVAKRIVECYQFAKEDKFRAVTHNKGIMNGVDAVCLATGQDWRAVESAAHAYAFEKGTGKYRSLTHYQIVEENGGRFFKGILELPISVGTVGGSVNRNPLYATCMNLLEKPNSQQLAQIITSVGLCQNLAALRALAIEGIQRGHMRLHSRAIAVKNKVPEHLVTQCCKFMQLRKKYDTETVQLFMDYHSKPKL